MTEAIPFLDLPATHRPILSALSQMFSDAVSGARFIGGKAVSDFEGAFAKLCQAQGCVGVANGTDALMLSLRALGVGRGDVVVVPAHTFIATAEGVTMAGATPRFVDVDPVTYTMSPKALEAVDNGSVRAVIPVHLYGQAAEMDPIVAYARKRGWKVVEDAAQAHGATYRGKSAGSFGDLTGFSFYPGKNLGALGDGGAVVGSDVAVLDRVRKLADHGRLTKYEHGEPGVNSRLDAIQAGALGIKLPYLKDWNAARARAAGWYNERLGRVKGITLPRAAEGRTHIYHLYVVQVPERERLMQSLGAANIGCGIHYPVPLHLQPAYRSLGYAKGDFPVSEQVAASCLSLPMFAELTEAQVDRVAKVVADHVKAGS